MFQRVPGRVDYAREFGLGLRSYLPLQLRTDAPVQAVLPSGPLYRELCSQQVTRELRKCSLRHEESRCGIIRHVLRYRERERRTTTTIYSETDIKIIHPDNSATTKRINRWT